MTMRKLPKARASTPASCWFFDATCEPQHRYYATFEVLRTILRMLHADRYIQKPEHHVMSVNKDMAFDSSVWPSDVRSGSRCSMDATTRCQHRERLLQAVLVQMHMAVKCSQSVNDSPYTRYRCHSIPGHKYQSRSKQNKTQTGLCLSCCIHEGIETCSR